MTRDEKIAESRRLQAKGQSLRVIGLTLGVTNSTVWKWLHPEETRARAVVDNARRAASKREWENAHDRALCSCGALMCVGAKRRGTNECIMCYSARRCHEQQARRERIATMWYEGLTLAQITVALDSTVNSIGTEITRMRHAGWDMPYRNAR